MDKAQAYAVLRIEPGCTEEEIKKAYAALSRQYHPEEYPEEFHAEFKILVGAFAEDCDDLPREQLEQHKCKHCHPCADGDCGTQRRSHA